MPGTKILMNKYEHIVVGGGISGMTAAILLARSGGKVALVEAFPTLAPTIRGFNRHGMHFDTGVHLLGGLGDNHPLDVYFKHLGLSENLTKIPFNQNGYDCFRFEHNEKQINIPFGYDNLKKTLHSAFPAEKEAIDCYLAKIKETFNLSPFLNFNRNFSIKSITHAETETLQSFLDSIIDNEDLKRLLCYHTLLYGTPPDEAMLSTHALVAGSYFMSAHSIEGGGRAIARAFQKVLADSGVDILTGSSVSKINHNSNREFEGLQFSDGTTIKAESCIWTAHPRTMVSCAAEGAFRPIFKRRINDLSETTSALILFGIAQPPTESLNRKNIFLWPDGNYSEILRGKATIKQSAIFISAGQTTQPNSKQAVTAVMPISFDKFAKWADSSLKNRPPDYKKLKDQLIKEFKTECFRRCPELYGKVEFVDCATPLTLKDYCLSPTGSLYGVAHTASQYNPLPVTKIKGLFMAGQSIIAPGVLGAIVSAYLTCGIISGHDKIHEELRCIYNG
ncbi:phytoene desaturase family protein [Maridesulfovibrio zosterae]|uniref:phytoene desaturase family protein n=1 Tax=Maridesulfovibrio zosterae TaxID=82171 RepID=UPI0004055E37|nr:FAD-dependent oxidoreductase [Maridesulfovibrio zosterae]